MGKSSGEVDALDSESFKELKESVDQMVKGLKSVSEKLDNFDDANNSGDARYDFNFGNTAKRKR